MKRFPLLPLATLVLAACQDAIQPAPLDTSMSVEASDLIEASDSVEISEPAVSTSLSAAAASFSDDFEVDLSQWVGKGGGAHHGLIVEDPLRPGNHVLTFTALGVAGDIFGSEVSVVRGETRVLSFEYLGLPNGGLPGDLGGAIGFAEDTPNRHRWLAGTIFCCGIEDDLLIDEGQWRKYDIEFDVFASGLPGQVFTFAVVPPSNHTIRVMLEDFPGSGGIPGDAFFDNIRLATLVAIDIKPGSLPNCIKKTSKGTIPVAILSTASFDAANVDASTVSIDGIAPIRSTGNKDVSEDGLIDLVLHFKTPALNNAGLLTNGNTLVVTGGLLDGTLIQGSDIIYLAGGPNCLD